MEVNMPLVTEEMIRAIAPKAKNIRELVAPLKLIPFQGMEFTDERLKRESNLKPVDLIELAKEKFKQGNFLIDDLKIIPIASPNGKTLFGIPVEEAKKLRKYFREKLSLPLEESADFKLVSIQSKKSNDVLTYASRIL